MTWGPKPKPKPNVTGTTVGRTGKKTVGGTTMGRTGSTTGSKGNKGKEPIKYGKGETNRDKTYMKKRKRRTPRTRTRITDKGL